MQVNGSEYRRIVRRATSDVRRPSGHLRAADHPDVGRRLPWTAARGRLHAALREAPDHYELLETRLVGRLAGFLFCCAGLIAGGLLAIDPPTGAIGGAG